MHAGEDLPSGATMPARETSALFGARVAVAGGGVAAATAAPLEGAGGASVPRCPASLLLCEQRPRWACRACGRMYKQPPGAAGGGGGASQQLPACIFCGLQLGPWGPSVLFSPPCCS